MCGRFTLRASAKDIADLFAVEIQLLNELGLAPNWDETVLGADCRAILQRISDLNGAKWGKLRLSSNQDGEIRQFLDRFITFHLGRVPSGRNEALAET